VLRFYGAELKPVDIQRYDELCARGGTALKLMFVLMMLAHDAALRQQIVCTANADVATQRKVAAFYRVIAIALRSIYVTPFTETSMKRIMLSTLEFCYVGWACHDADGITHYCDRYAARSDLPLP
jgi:hypothetical protein